MVICPKCNEEISSLLAYSEVVNNFELDENGEPVCEKMNHIEGYVNFECPECHEELFKHEGDAVDFLETDDLKKVLKEKIKNAQSN